MQDNNRISAYLHSLDVREDAFLNKLRVYAGENDVPIIRQETEELIKTLLVMQKPASILEIGAAIGYSSIVMAKASEADIITIENYEKRIPIAIRNIEAAGLSNRIKLRAADAGEELKAMAGAGNQFDLIFLDAAKGQYLIWLPDILALMHPGSILIADNVLQDQTVAESRFTIPRRERTTHERMREFLYQIKHNSRLVTSILNVGDGVSLSVMR